MAEQIPQFNLAMLTGSSAAGVADALKAMPAVERERLLAQMQAAIGDWEPAEETSLPPTTAPPGTQAGKTPSGQSGRAQQLQVPQNQAQGQQAQDLVNRDDNTALEQRTPLNESSNENWQAMFLELQGQLAGLEGKFAAYQGSAAAATAANTAGRPIRTSKSQPWYKLTKAKQTRPQQAAMKKLKAMIMLALRTLINVEEKSAALPAPGSATPREDGSPVFNVDFTKGPDDSYNRPLVLKAVENVNISAKDPNEGFGAISDCPEINADAIEHLTKKSFVNLKKTYKEQTDAAAILAKKLREHKNRALSTMRHKCERRLEAVLRFIELYERDPTDMLRHEHMSADESANGDEELTTRWWNLLQQPGTMRTKQHKPLATQSLSWRAAWVTWVFYELDRLYLLLPQKSAVRAVFPRVAAHNGGRKVEDPPAVIPPVNMVDVEWFAARCAETPATIDIEAWRAAVPYEGWGSYEKESAAWPPFYAAERVAAGPAAAAAAAAAAATAAAATITAA